MEKYYPYDCKQCGNCCRHINLVEPIKNLDRGDGVCIHLTEKSLCEIYPDRPPVCNGKYVYENFYSDMTVSDFHKMIKELCKKIREMGN